MDILIKGIEIPKSGSITVTVYSDMVWCDSKTNEHHGEVQIVPPHGRLSDADRIAGVIRTKIDDVPCEKQGLYSIRNGAYRDGLIRAYGIVDGAPTVLEASE